VAMIKKKNREKRRSPVDDRTKATRNMDHAATAGENIVQHGQERYAATMENARDLNTKLVEMVRANADVALEAANHITSAKTPADLAQAWSNYATKQFAILSNQAKELTVVWQRFLIPPS